MLYRCRIAAFVFTINRGDGVWLTGVASIRLAGQLGVTLALPVEANARFFFFSPLDETIAYCQSA